MALVASWFFRAFIFVGLTLTLCTVISLFENTHWLAALFSHFKLQYVLFQSVGVLAILFAGLCRKLTGQRLQKSKVIQYSAVGILFLISATYNLQPLWPYLMAKQPTFENQQTMQAVTLMHINIFAINRRKDDVLAAIQSNQPDIIDFVEFTPEWQRQIETSDFLKQYPYHVSGKAHVAIYSKFPIQSSSRIS